MALGNLQDIEDEIIERVGQYKVDRMDNRYRYEANMRVKLDDSKSIGSLLTYSVYGKTRLEAAHNLLKAIKKDEKEFEALRGYYSLKGKVIGKLVLNQEFGNYTIAIHENTKE